MPKSSPAPLHKTVIPHASRRLWHGNGPGGSAIEPIIVVAVAVLYVALAVSNGGYSRELTAGATVGIWWAVLIAIALGGRPRSRVPTAALGAGVCLAALAAWTAISISWASDNGSAFFEAVRVLGYLGVFVLVVIASPRASARAWLGGVAVGLVIVAGLALLSRFEPSFGGGKELGAFLPAAAGRLSYPIGYWNGLAAVMAMGVVLLVWLGGQARAAGVRAASVGVIPWPILVVYLASSRGGVIAGVAGLAVLLGLGPARARMFVGLVLGGAGGGLLILLASRQHELVNGLGNSAAASQGDQMLAVSIAIVVAVGILRFLLDSSIGKLEVPATVARAVGVAALVAVIGGILIAGPSARWEEFKQVAPVETKSTYVAAHLSSGRGSGRYQFWSAAVDAFEAHPFHGIGAAGYEAYWDQHGSLAVTIRDAHSLFLESMAELGLVGLALILGFLGFAAVSGIGRGPRRSRGGALTAVLAILVTGIVSAAIDWTWELSACFGLVVLAAALLAGPATLGKQPPLGEVTQVIDGRRARPSRRTPARFGLGVATLLVGWAAIWAGGTVFLTEVRLGDSRAAASARNLDSAAQDARDASTLQPWAAGPRLQLALVEELGGNIQAANRDLGEAIQRAPHDWQLWFVRARLKVKAGDVSGARHALARARQLNPRAPFFSQ
jgi:O-antigen ligase/polysaccharide polymerase Wzy-like membrane protein